jgi:hypothetical protein
MQNKSRLELDDYEAVSNLEVIDSFYKIQIKKK